jgi:hypothetical protein
MKVIQSPHNQNRVTETAEAVEKCRLKKFFFFFSFKISIDFKKWGMKVLKCYVRQGKLIITLRSVIRPSLYTRPQFLVLVWSSLKIYQHLIKHFVHFLTIIISFPTINLKSLSSLISSCVFVQVNVFLCVNGVLWLFSSLIMTFICNKIFLCRLFTWNMELRWEAWHVFYLQTILACDHAPKSEDDWRAKVEKPT